MFQAVAWTMGTQAATVEFAPDGKLSMAVRIPTYDAVGMAESAQDSADHDQQDPAAECRWNRAG